MDELITRSRMRAILCDWGHALDTVAGYERDLKMLRSRLLDAYDTRGAARLDCVPSGGVHTGIVARAVERVERLKAEYLNAEKNTLKRATELLSLKSHIDVEISRLDDIEQQIMRMRYQDGHEWARIAKMLQCSEQQARAIDTHAVDILRGALNEQRGTG